MDEGLIVIGADGSVLAFDLGAERLLGLAQGDMRVGSSLSPLVGEEVVARLLAAAPARCGGEAADSCEVELEAGDRRLTALVTRLSEQAGATASVLVRIRAFGAAGVGRDLAARLSREMRAPLAAIRGCSETLLGGAIEESDRTRRFLEMMEHNADQLELLAEDLSAYAQVEHGWVRENRRAVDVCPILGSTARSQASSVIRRGVAVHAVPNDRRVVVAAVPQLFERSFRGVVAEVVRVARRGEEILCAARCTRAEQAPARVAEIVVERDPQPAAGQDAPREVDMSAASLRMDTIREVVRVHGGWMRASGAQGQINSVRIFWPLWGVDSPEPGLA